MTPARPNDLLVVEGLDKAFTLHLHGGARLPVVADVGFAVARGECVVLGGPSGVGKSSILKIVFGNYRGRARPYLARRRRPLPRHRAREPARDRRRAPAHDGLCQPVPARHPARLARSTSSPRRRATRGSTRGQRAGARGVAARAPQPARAAVVVAARDLLGRRAAARQHRARLRRRAQPAHPRRADRLARRSATARRWSSSSPSAARRARASSPSSTTRTCARASPTG